MRVWAIGFSIATHLVLTSGSSPVVAQGDRSAENNKVNRQIRWTKIPQVDREDATLQRGIVYGSDGKPLDGANVYAASNIELFEIRKAEEVTTKDLGEVRAVTDHLGRFEFHTPDLTWMPASGQQKRWETA